jgi:isoleucyl-tRNA synthetase
METIDLLKIEGAMLDKWSEEKTRQKINEKNKNNKVFFFLEGPPYANGELHMGHARGYIRKDAVLRYKRMRKFSVFDRAGFDVHGLPIENKVEKHLGIVSKKEIESKFGVQNFVKSCTETYRGHMKAQIDDAMKYGIWFDFENAYIPASPDYIDKAFGVFKKIYDKGRVYRDTQVMPYCMHCGTVLAKGPEVEEADDEDPSAYVLFRVDKKASKAKIELNDNTCLLVWTTTPWTLLGNVAIAANPKELYVEVEIEGYRAILGKALLDSVSQQLGSSLIVRREFYGSELEGVKYANPLYSKPTEGAVPKQNSRAFHTVVLDEALVTMSEGTGLVHIAPAYGPEDFELSKRKKLPLISVVDSEGIYTQEVGKYAGKHLIHEANREIETELKNANMLLAKTTIKHKYPHCWRCKEKLVYLPTTQWFIRISTLKNKIKNACQKVEWHPAELKDWFIDAIELAPDWTISRQRYWGIPIPIWTCDSCKSVKVIGSFEELKMASGMNLNFTEETLHRPVIDEIALSCDSCGGVMHRIKDVFDVWFDSGVAHTASLSAEEFSNMYSKAFITEGPDQIRGWFATLIKTGIAAYGKSPFSTVVMQGWVLGENGEPMHKSKGTYVAAHDLVGKYSIDAVRLFTLAHVTHENLQLKFGEIEKMQAFLLLLHSVADLIGMYSDIVPQPYAVPSSFRLNANTPIEDRWILSRLNSVIGEVTKDMDNYELYQGISAITDFVTNDLSRFYIKAAKKRIANSKAAESRRTVDIISCVLYNALLMLAPIMPFNAEFMFRNRFGRGESIFSENWPKANKKLVDTEVERRVGVAREVITAILNSREKAGISLRMPVLGATIEAVDDSAVTTIQEMSTMIQEFANVKSLRVAKGTANKKKIVPRFDKLGPVFKNNSQEVAEGLKSQDADAVERAVAKDGYFALHTTNGTVEVKPEHFMIVETPVSGNASAFKYGTVSIDTSQTEAILEESLVREAVRRIQMMRKEMKLTRLAKVNVHIGADAEVAGILNKNKAQMAKIVVANSISVQNGLPDGKNLYKKDWEVADTVLSIGIERAD